MILINDFDKILAKFNIRFNNKSHIIVNIQIFNRMIYE
jgi:hypothetical protein